MSGRPLTLPLGSVAIRMRVFGRADQDLAELMAPPWSRPVRRLYELWALESSHVDVVKAEIPYSAGLEALRKHLNHHLEMLVFLCSHLEELGWEIQASGEHLVAHRVMVPGAAREVLARQALTAGLQAVADLDGHGGVRLYERWELAPEAAEAHE